MRPTLRFRPSSRGAIQLWLLFGVVLTSILWLGFLARREQFGTASNFNPDQEIEIKTNQDKTELQIEPMEQEKQLISTTQLVASGKVVTFYYPWYGNPEVNGEWIHWNHEVLVKDGSRYVPPDNIGANFYPELGPYSSSDPAVIDQHMKWMAEARVGIVCTSWWGKSNSDGQLKNSAGFTDRLVTMLLDSAEKHGLKIAIHLEPYEGRSAASVREDVIYVIEKYGNHPAFFRDSTRQNRPMFFFYDSYLTPATEWATILSPTGDHTIRGTTHDAIMIGLYVDNKDKHLITQGYFDGFYTYFATDGFTVGSSTHNWPELQTWATASNKMFLPCVGPGYADTRIRPWNGQNQRDRRGGAYYDEMWQKAIGLRPPFIGVTSFNEWHEGTQIEPSIPKQSSGYRYLDFSPLEPDYYLRKTKQWVDIYDPFMS